MGLLLVFSCGVVQAALAVGAVKEGHATVTAKGRNRTPMSTQGKRNKADLDCSFGEQGGGAYEEKRHVRSPGEGRRCPERRVPGKTGHEFGCRSEDETGEKAAAEEANVRPRRVPSTGGRAPANSFSERNRPATYRGGFYHDSRREVELMPTLREIDAPLEHPGSPARSQPPFRLQQTTQGGENSSISVKLEPTDARRRAKQASPTTTVTTKVERGKAEKGKHFGDTTSRVLRGIDDQQRGPLMEHRRPSMKKATGASSSCATEHRAEDQKGSVEHCSTETGYCASRARETGGTKETTDRGSTTTSATDVGTSTDLMASDQAPSPHFAVARPKGSFQAATSEVSGQSPMAPAKANMDMVATKVREDAVISGQDPPGLSKQPGTVPARDVNVTVTTDACAGAQQSMARAAVSFSLKENGNDQREDGGLSPAPYHGGSLFAVQLPSSTTPAACEGLKGPPCRAPVHLRLHQGKQPTHLLPGLERDASDKPKVVFHTRSCQSTSLVTDTSSGSGDGLSSRMIGAARPKADSVDREKHATRLTDKKMVQDDSLRPGWDREGRDGHSRRERLDGDGSVPLREFCTERKEEELGHETHIDDATMNFEAASATIFDELLEPRVVAVYSR